MINFCFEGSSYQREQDMISLALHGVMKLGGREAQTLKRPFSQCFCFLYVSDGEALVDVYGERVKVNAGSVAVILPNNSFEVGMSPKGNAYAVFFTCTPASFIPFARQVTVVGSDKDETYKYLRLYGKLRTGSTNEQCEVSLLDIVYGTVCVGDGNADGRRLFERFREYCREHRYEPIDVGSVAEYLGYSRDHLCRTVRKECGKTSKEYISEVRLSAALELLSEAKMSVSEAARRMGFASNELFTKFIRYHTKKTPNYFKNRTK